MKAQHSAKSVEHYTPVAIVEAAHVVLGRIDLDPASCAKANETVRARAFWTERGVEQMLDYDGPPVTMLVNPPGGWHQRGRETNPQAFWRALRMMRHRRKLVEAIWVGFSLEQLVSLQRSGAMSPLDLTMCVPSKRLCFLDADGKPQTRPTHGNFITYVDGLENRKAAFHEAFLKFGAVVRP